MTFSLSRHTRHIQGLTFRILRDRVPQNDFREDFP